jgi:hypothetical protein
MTKIKFRIVAVAVIVLIVTIHDMKVSTCKRWYRTPDGRVLSLTVFDGTSLTRGHWTSGRSPAAGPGVVSGRPVGLVNADVM